MSIYIKESIPGLNEAKTVESAILRAGIKDIKLFYDKTIMPNGLWAMCQVNKNTSQILIPNSYNENKVEPTILWWCKDNEGRFRLPNENDINDVIVIVSQAGKTWEQGGDKLDDKFIEQDIKKQADYKQAQRDKIHSFAPDLQKAIRKELG